MSDTLAFSISGMGFNTLLYCTIRGRYLGIRYYGSIFLSKRVRESRVWGNITLGSRPSSLLLDTSGGIVEIGNE